MSTEIHLIGMSTNYFIIKNLLKENLNYFSETSSEENDQDINPFIQYRINAGKRKGVISESCSFSRWFWHTDF